jgi:hypothetical protein
MGDSYTPPSLPVSEGVVNTVSRSYGSTFPYVYYQANSASAG